MLSIRHEMWLAHFFKCENFQTWTWSTSLQMFSEWNKTRLALPIESSSTMLGFVFGMALTVPIYRTLFWYHLLLLSLQEIWLSRFGSDFNLAIQITPFPISETRVRLLLCRGSPVPNWCPASVLRFWGARIWHFSKPGPKIDWSIDGKNCAGAG